MIQCLYFKLYIKNINSLIKWKNTIETINLERDRYKISNYRYAQKDSWVDDYPELAKEWHPTKNDGLTPNMFKSGSSFSAWWKCSTCGNEWKASIHSRTHGRECLKCSRANHSGVNHYMARKIYQYTKDGIFIKEWDFISEASRTEKINSSNISMCAEGKRAVAGGYRWSYEYFEKLPPIQKQHKSRKGMINLKAVKQLDIHGNVINTFVSLNDAAEKTGINATSISKAIHGHIRTAGGFVWEVDKPSV